jgi:DNA polymerase-3 subunit alpha (Gram-positive type)
VGVLSASIDPEGRKVEARLKCGQAPDGELIRRVERELSKAYRMKSARLYADESAEQRPESVPAPAEEPTGDDGEMDAFSRTEAIRQSAIKKLAVSRSSGKKQDGVLLFGSHLIKRAPVSIGSLELDMGTVVVEGDVFFVEHRQMKKRSAWVVSFDLTDYTGSIRVSKFMPGNEGLPIVNSVKQGQHLKIQGRLNINRFDNEMVLEPLAIALCEKKKRRPTTRRKSGWSSTSTPGCP